MTKSLSQQLCELCGIDPKRHKNIDMTTFTDEIKKGVTTHIQRIYPDFENNNNNIVKLINLFIPKIEKTLIACMTFCCIAKGSIRSTDNLLEQLICYLSKNDLLNEQRRNLIKQAIREAEWE